MSEKGKQTEHSVANSVIEKLIRKNDDKHFSFEELEKFIRRLYSYVPEDDLHKFGTETLYTSAKSVFKFLQDKPKAFKVRVFNPTLKDDGWESRHTIVEVINNDMPFLVDSIAEEVARHDVQIYQLAHPVIEVVRNNKGRFESLLEQGVVEENSVTESVMSLKVSHIGDAKGLKELEAGIVKVIEALQYTYKDWMNIVKKASFVETEFSASMGLLSKNVKGDNKTLLTENIQEIKEFLEWLKDDNFIFLGYIEYGLAKRGKNKNLELAAVKDSQLGIFKIGDSEIEPKNTVLATTKEIIATKGTNLIYITKANKKSLIHRAVHMDYITIKRLNDDGEVIGEHRFIGMFTSRAYHQSATNIPLIRKKIQTIVEGSGFPPGGHSFKAMVAILEDFPRDELFQTDEEHLFEATMGIVALTLRPRVRFFVRPDHLERFMSCIIYIPREIMSTQLRGKMEKILEEAFNGHVSTHYTQITESHLARLQVIIKTTPGKVHNFNVKEIEAKLAQAGRLWEDSLFDELVIRHGEELGTKYYNNYKEAFSVSYKNRFNALDAYYDIDQMTKVIESNEVRFDVYPSEDSSILNFKVYSPTEQITLHKIMPVLENMGIHTIDEHTYQVEPLDCETVIWIHRFRFSIPANQSLQFEHVKRNFEEAVERIWFNKMQNDGLNKLIMTAGLQWQQVVLLRAYSKYLQQAGFIYSQAYIQEALSNHPGLVKSLVGLFFTRFNPELDDSHRADACDAMIEDMEKTLGRVSNLAEDRVIRAVLELIQNTLRCNFFQKDSETGLDKEYLSFKFQSSNISFLPKPKPYAEIFVYSPRVEGVHLRGGKVARGGLRWSDRREDFRTEILGLMKAQMTKNSVIIPVGSKGGFVVKQPPEAGDRESFHKEGIECYKIFLSGLLDITDNMKSGNVVPPVDVVRYDGDDPYLVVAADKGTASFSDIANDLANDYGFWLRDAFASGGSVGYDHKKMGITAKGAWISVQRHFSEMGVDVQKDEFTVVGIGDMGGDVFGNGMLLSDQIRLIAAFNHIHIFVDPSPDAAKSFKERKRLFKLPRSSWLDYKKELISAGGGVFERSAKLIPVTKQMKGVLGIKEDVLTPDELIKAILKAQVDLLWNGGIGTYVKSRRETQDDVGDKANDNLRINGGDLRVKVVGEGGNLGLTQLGRIEYALNGGRINTDSIDNSAGVDCSDHEVNIKIALVQAVEKKKLSMKKRNELLESMTDEVAELVLRDNILQTQAITISELQGSSLLGTQASLISSFEREGRLDREIEFLPIDDEISRRQTDGIGLMRPELSVIFAYSKIALFEQLLDTDLPDDPHYSSDLIRYFPEKIQKSFKNEIESHPLRREIVATAVANSIVNRIGSSMFYHLQEDTAMSVDDIARAYTITRDVFGLREMWEEIEELQGTVKVEAQVQLFVEIQYLVERISLWFLRHRTDNLNITEIVTEFSPGVKALGKCLTDILPESVLKAFRKRFEDYSLQQVPMPLAEKIAGLEAMSSACDIVSVATKYDLPVNVVGKTYFDIGARLQIGWMRYLLNQMDNRSYWEKTSVNTLIEELFDEQRRLTSDVIKTLSRSDKSENALEAWMEANEKQIQRYDHFMEDLKAREQADVSMVIVAIRKVREIGQ